MNTWRFGETAWKLCPPSHTPMHLFHLAAPKVACECAKSLRLCPTFAIPWTVAHQAPLSMGFSRQEYWSGLPCPAAGDLSDPVIFLTQGSNWCLLGLLHWEADSLPLRHLGGPLHCLGEGICREIRNPARTQWEAPAWLKLLAIHKSLTQI